MLLSNCTTVERVENWESAGDEYCRRDDIGMNRTSALRVSAEGEEGRRRLWARRQHRPAAVVERSESIVAARRQACGYV